MYLLQDDMRRESRRFIFPMVAFTFYSLLSIIVLFIDTRETIQEIARKSMVSVPLSIVMGYLWLSASKYKLTVTSELLTLRTVFRRYEIYLCNITGYTCKNCGPSVLYQFCLHTEWKQIMVSTRYRDEFIKILEDAHIAEKAN